MIFSAAISYAVDLSKSTLQGDWVITEFHGSPDSDGDMWQFEESNFYQNIGGHRTQPDSFTTSKEAIDLGHTKITIDRFDGKTMEATMAGFRYKLVKK